MKIIFTLLLSVLTQSSFATVIYDLESKMSISYQTLIQQIAPAGNILLGEYHNRQNIQNFQAKFIKDHATYHNMEGAVTLAWEFLEYTDAEKISALYDKLQKGEIDSTSMITALFPKGNSEYAVTFDAIASVSGDLIGVNAPRSYKTELRTKGLGGVDPSILPPNMRLGTELYLQRFREAMGGHTPEEKILSYFLAQSYTDCVMAHQLMIQSKTLLNYFIMGSFHSDYFDGTTLELTRLTSEPVVTLKILERADAPDEILNDLINGDPAYGQIANYLVVIE